MYSSKLILPLWSLSIWSKFHLTISSVMVIFSGLKVSSMSLLNSSISITSSSWWPSPWGMFWALLAGGLFTGLFFLALRALSPKKAEN